MQQIVQLLQQNEHRDQKKCNAEQVAILRSPVTDYVYQGLTALIKQKPVVEMDSNFADRSSRAIFMRGSWDIASEIKVNIIVTEPTRIQEWQQAFAQIGVESVLVVDKPKDAKFVMQNIASAQVVVMSHKRTKDFAALLKQQIVCVSDQQDKMNMQQLNDLMASTGDLQEQNLEQINHLRSKLIFVLQQVAKGEPIQLIQRCRVLQGPILQRVVYDVPISTHDVRRLYAKMTWLLHDENHRTTRDKFSLEVDTQLSGIDRKTITTDLFEYTWNLLKDRCLLQQTHSFFQQARDDIFTLSRQVSLSEMNASIGNDDQMMQLMPTLPLVQTDQQLSDHYRDMLMQSNRLPEDIRQQYSNTSKNCVQIIEQEERKQCMVCFSEPERCKIVYCCCCFVTCLSCLMRIIISGRNEHQYPKCPQCRKYVTNRLPLQSIYETQSYLLSIVMIPVGGHTISRPEFEDESMIIAKLQRSCNEKQALFKLQDLMKPQTLAIAKGVNHFIITVTLSDLQAASLAMQKPAEMAYPDAVIKACATISKCADSTGYITIQFAHIVSKGSRKLILTFPRFA